MQLKSCITVMLNLETTIGRGCQMQSFDLEHVEAKGAYAPFASTRYEPTVCLIQGLRSGLHIYRFSEAKHLGIASFCFFLSLR